MKIESIHIENYKALQNVDIKNIGQLAVFLGENGVGKSTLFDVFGFMKQCLTENIRSALQSRGGYDEVHSRDSNKDILFSFQYRIEKESPLCTYELNIGLDAKRNPIINRERLSYRRGSGGKPWSFIDFSRGEGEAITNEDAEMQNIQDAKREKFVLDSPDILAIKSLGQMKRFQAAVEFRRLIEDWFVSDFQINAARQTQDISYMEQLNRNGDNIANVTQFLADRYPERYMKILDKMKNRIPGMEKVESKTTEGRIFLRFSDGKFREPFSSRFVSDGTIKMFAYLVMLADPNPHKLLCIEEPENQLYPHLLKILAEEFREYTFSGGQVFISTHSPEFVNAIELNELFIIKKQNGFSQVEAIANNENVVSLYQHGDDKLGYLWQEGLL
ncbi:AAA family ATPase [Breznakiellaceae bacterium SP9]